MKDNDIALLREALISWRDEIASISYELAQPDEWACRSSPREAFAKDPSPFKCSAILSSVAGRMSAKIAALAPGQHDGAASPSEEWLNDPASLEGGLTITDDEINDAIAHGFGERFTDRAAPKPAPTEQARAEGDLERIRKALPDLQEQVRVGMFAKQGHVWSLGECADMIETLLAAAGDDAVVGGDE